MNDSHTFLKVTDLKTRFHTPEGTVYAVNGVSFTLKEGETLAVVGESGCGKTTAGRTLLGLYPATSGKTIIDTHSVYDAKGKELMHIRRKAQMIFQDPYASLNPRWTVNAIISEPLRVHKLMTNQQERDARVKDLLELVGLNARQINRFPHEFSGGQRQRIGIARALYKRANVLVFDEATSALDSVTESSVMEAIEELNRDMTVILIAHRITTVRRCDIIVELDRGRVVAIGSYDSLVETSASFRKLAAAAS